MGSINSEFIIYFLFLCFLYQKSGVHIIFGLCVHAYLCVQQIDTSLVSTDTFFAMSVMNLLI